MLLIQKTLIGLALLGSCVAAHAGPVYSYDVQNPGGSARAGDIKNVQTTYNSATHQFTWSYEINSNKGNDAFWLVVSDGGDPKGVSNQLAILYGDFTSSHKPNAADNTITAYVYNGENNSSSYSDKKDDPSYVYPGSKLWQWDNEINVVEDMSTGIQTVSFSIHVGILNSNFPSTVDYPNADNWEGVQFGESLGIWFHPSADSSFSYNAISGDISSYQYKKQSWYDVKDRVTDVPEPAGIALLAAGLLGFGMTKRQRKSAA